MRIRPAILLALATLVIGAFPAASGLAERGDATGDFVVVRYDTGVSAQALSADGMEPSLAERGYRKLEVPAGVSRDDFLAQLRDDPDVVSAEADAPVFAAAVPDDPYYALNQAQYLNPIGAPAAWDLSTGSSSIVVAVLDSGTDLGHPEFAGRLWENTRETVGDGIDNDGNGCVDDRYGCRFVDPTPERVSACGYSGSTVRTGAVSDDNGRAGSGDAGSHGTLVAGVIGAAGNNGKGVAGIAWNVKIMTVKVLDCGVPSRGGKPSGEMSSVALGIDYARRMGANIISLSLASRPGDPTADLAVLRDAIQAAQDQGIIIVAAAGNHAATDIQVGPGYPAAYTQYPNLLAIGASDNANGNTWATYSNYGPAIDFAAPGSDIVGPIRSDLGLSNIYGQAETGTSFATPIVSGMFALMMARNTRLTAAEYIQIARDAATPAQPAPHGQNWAGAGVVNIGAAVARVPMTITGNALHDWKDVAPNTEVRASVGTNICGTTTTVAIGPVARYTLRVSSTAEVSGCGAPGEVVRVTVGGQAAQQAFTWGGRDEDLGLTGKDVVTISPPPGSVVVQALGSGWSNVAHLEASGPLPEALSYLPSWEIAYSWDPFKPGANGLPGAYRRAARTAPEYVSDWTSAQTFDTFWVKSTAGNVASVNPNPPPGRVVTLQPGWNNFVYTGSAKAVADALAEIGAKYTQVLQYDNANGRWLSYLPGQSRFLQDFAGLFKLKVYWIFMTAPGSITMS